MIRFDDGESVDGEDEDFLVEKPDVRTHGPTTTLTELTKLLRAENSRREIKSYADAQFSRAVIEH